MTTQDTLPCVHWYATHIFLTNVVSLKLCVKHSPTYDNHANNLFFSFSQKNSDPVGINDCDNYGLKIMTDKVLCITNYFE